MTTNQNQIIAGCRVEIKQNDMSDDMKNQVMEITKGALERCNTEKEIASFIKNEINNIYKGSWHCAVGRYFGAFVTHEAKHYIYFYLGQRAFLLFKSG